MAFQDGEEIEKWRGEARMHAVVVHLLEGGFYVQVHRSDG